MKPISNDAREPGSLHRIVRRLCIPRRLHHCRLCGGRINIGEPCERWTYFDDDGPGTSHAHPECYRLTAGWKDWDWECCAPGDVKRPNAKVSDRHE